jgi:voltage-gated potassium channel
LFGISALGLLVEELDVQDAFAFVTKCVGIGAHALLLLCAANILTVVFRAGRVTLDGIFASIVVYELTGLFFAQTYPLMTLFDRTSLLLPNGLPSSPQVVQFDMIYFSFVTLATLGYGDIVPVSSLARSTAMLEAIAGKFYVAVIVAVLVSAFVAQRLESQAAPRD